MSVLKNKKMRVSKYYDKYRNIYISMMLNKLKHKQKGILC